MNVQQKFKNLVDISKAFPDDRSCIGHLMYLRHGDKSPCPYCSNDGLNYIQTRRKFQCKKCRKQFSPLTGTIFEQTNIPLTKWFMVLYLFTSFKKGVSSLQVSREIGVTQKTAWLMIQKVRESLREKGKITFTGEIEVDEVYLGGKSKNKHASKKVQNTQGKNLQTKVPVLGMYERSSGKTHCLTVRNTTGAVLLDELKKAILMGSSIYTDENNSYVLSENFYDRQYTTHSAKEFVNGRCHTNNMERIWGMVRRGFIGTYHHMSYKHMNRYLAEFTYRSEYSCLLQEDRFNLIFSKINNVIRCPEITQFNMYEHNYSGRGPAYPVELLKATKRRGRLSKERESELKKEGKYSYFNSRKNKESFTDLYHNYSINLDEYEDTPKFENKRGRPKGSRNKVKSGINNNSYVKTAAFNGFKVIK